MHHSQGLIGRALGLALALVCTGAGAQAQVPAMRSCEAPEHRQFDFWIGEWTVYGAKGAQLGESRVEAVANGCALLEHWSGSGGYTGKSLNSYDRKSRRWHQHWVGSDGGKLELLGALVEGKMVLEAAQVDPDKPGAIMMQRITWSLNPDASVRQLWQTSLDGGKSWSTAFDGTYVRRK